MADVKVTGTENFLRVAKALNAQGKAGKGLWKELNGALKDAAKPMEQAVRQPLEPLVRSPERVRQEPAIA